jgi:hypothetical protein
MHTGAERVQKKQLRIVWPHLRCMDEKSAEATAKLAYTLWLRRGCPEGSPEEDWYEAERILSASNATDAGRETPTLRKAPVTPRSKKSKSAKTKAAGA